MPRGVRRRWIAAGLLLALCLVGGDLARRAFYGQGKVREFAVGAYRRYKAEKLQRAYAAEIVLERAEAPLVIYGDALGAGWKDWSWARHDLASAKPVREGKRAITFVPEGNKGVYLQHDALGTSGYGFLRFSVFGEAVVNVAVVGGGGEFGKPVPLAKYLSPDPGASSGWRIARIPLADLGIARYNAFITGVVFQAAKAEPQPVISLDAISLEPDSDLPPAPAETTVAVTVDTGSDRHPISPYIYGMAFAPPDYIRDLRLAVNRWGGNDKSRYNWVHGNACNAARDWHWANRVVRFKTAETSSADDRKRQTLGTEVASLKAEEDKIAAEITAGEREREEIRRERSQRRSSSAAPSTAAPRHQAEIDRLRAQRVATIKDGWLPTSDRVRALDRRLAALAADNAPLLSPSASSAKDPGEPPLEGRLREIEKKLALLAGERQRVQRKRAALEARLAAPVASVTPSWDNAADEFVRNNGGAASFLTVPTIGWVARDTNNGNQSRNVPATGAPPLTDADGAIVGYDPAVNRAATSVRSAARKGKPFVDRPDPASSVVYQDEWINHLVRTHGGAAKGGVRFYAMDNEPDLWHHTHTDVHPAQMGYDDIRDRFLEYADAVKDVDPAARITGPVSWGWSNYLYSPLDQGDDKYRTHADRKRHGDEPFLLWFLKQVRAHDGKKGRRTLDVLDIHYYPQGQGLFQGASDPDAQRRRLRSTRSLWDTGYTDESWIGEPVRLIPRMREWIGAGYPGTKLGITEWNFGADGDIHGGLAVADVLGIFGREDVFLANYWAHPRKGTPGYLAFQLYRNADGKGAGFGDVSCRAVSADPDRLSAFAATDAKTGDLTLMLVNKHPKTTIQAPITIGALRTAGPARMWRFSKAKPGAITPLPGPAVSGGTLRLTLPPYSATLVRVPVAKGGSA